MMERQLDEWTPSLLLNGNSVDLYQVAYMQFQSLIVLPFNLQFCLQLFNEKIKAGDFRAQLV